MKRYRTTARLPAAAVTLAPVPMALGQAGDSPNLQAPTDTVTNIRPLRTFRGEAVLVPRQQAERSIGVVRPLRVAPASIQPNPTSYYNRADRSDRWLVREIARGRILLPAPGVEESVGVVRAYRSVPTNRVEQRPGVVTFTNPNAESNDSEQQNRDTVGPNFPQTAEAGDASVYAFRQVEDLPEGEQADPWALLNQGFYRNAEEAFAEGDDSPESRTGRALAAALSGNLAAVADLMPGEPTLPQGVTLSAATQRRINQTAQFLFADEAELQQALRSLTGEPQDNAPTAK